MLGKGNKKSARIDASVVEAVNYELTIADIARRSEKRAWRVAMAAALLVLIMAAGIFFMIPLKREVPYLVMADAYTGTATVAKLHGKFERNSIYDADAINRSNIHHYISARESYDDDMRRIKDWVTVNTMSTSDVIKPYHGLYSRTNPESPASIYGKTKSIRVSILSTTLLPRSGDGYPRAATVRFQRMIYDKNNGTSQLLDSKIATLEYRYNKNLSMTERARIENPLGFQVSAYQVENDYAAAPSIENVITSGQANVFPSVNQSPATSAPQTDPTGVGLPNHPAMADQAPPPPANETQSERVSQ